ncbi:hypothetical protein ACMYMP_23145, partial [Salmonella enterica subsp. enterica serovar Enteritidis]|uniref:hypothetical protein n=1 Tax=Salmonella enterica TaxID=28901 RepID=UPI0039EAE4E1
LKKFLWSYEIKKKTFYKFFQAFVFSLLSLKRYILKLVRFEKLDLLFMFFKGISSPFSLFPKNTNAYLIKWQHMKRAGWRKIATQ